VGEFFSYALPGLPSGCTFALVAVGLVLTYRATGVFNFAFGSEAFAAGAVYSEMYWHGVNNLMAALIVVFIIGPAFGALLDYGLFSRIPSANVTAKFVTALGVMVFLPQVVSIFVGPSQIYSPPPLFFSPALIGSWGTVALNGSELSTILITTVVLAVLTVFLRSRRFGLPIRAAVESPQLLELTGVNSRWVLRSAWMISTALASLAGVLLASNSTTVDNQTYGTILVIGIAAAALGAMRSLTLAVVGGLGMGVIQGVVPAYIPTDTVWYQALVPSLPFFVLLAMLILHPGMRRLEQSNDPMSAVNPPPPTPALAIRAPIVNEVLRRYRWLVLAGALAVTVTFVPGPWILTLSLGAAMSMVFLSITLMTGLAGQLSLAQATFMGIGAFTAAQLAVNQHVPILFAGAAGAVVAGLGGVLAALPALRMRGLPVALLTLCLSLLADNLLFKTSWISNGDAGLVVPRPRIFNIKMDDVDSKSFFILAFVALLAVAGVVHTLLRGTTGRALAAAHASPAGAMSAGVPVRRFTVLLFMLSAAIAGFGGAFYAMANQQVNYDSFYSIYGPTFLVIVVTLGVTSVQSAIEAGFAFQLIQQAMQYLPSRAGTSFDGPTVTILLLSLGAFTYAKHPEGIVEFLKHRFALLVLRARPHMAAPPSATEPTELNQQSDA
jgi:branched-chain amino acid transport system permease protein